MNILGLPQKQTKENIELLNVFFRTFTSVNLNLHILIKKCIFAHQK